MSRIKTWDEMLWPRVIKLESCWEWSGKLDKDGYGIIKRKIPKSRHHKNHKAHRVAYEITKGPIPAGLFVCHSCDNRKCVNPEHLWVGTAKDNNKDCQAKNRHPRKHIKNHL